MTAFSIHSKADRLGSWLGLALVVSSAAWGGAPEDTPSRESTARARFEEATKQYNAGKFDEALKQYKEVYDLKRHPALLFNIAQCYRQLGEYAVASFYYRRYSDEARPNSADAQVVKALIAEVEAKQAEREGLRRAQTTEASPRDAEVARVATPKLQPTEKHQAGDLLGAAPTGAAASNSVFTKWWFWTAAGVLVTSISIYYAVPAHPRRASLGDLSVRGAQ